MLNDSLAIARAEYLWRLRLARPEFGEQLQDVYDVLDAVLDGADRATDGLSEARAEYARRLRVDCPSLDEQLARARPVAPGLAVVNRHPRDSLAR